MKQDEKKQIQDNMLDISKLIESGNEDKKVANINYYKDFTFQNTNLAETEIYVAKIESGKEDSDTYEIYSGKTNTLIAEVDAQGKLHFLPEYIESLRQISPILVQRLKLEGVDFVLPQELGKDDMVLTREEKDYMISIEIKSKKDKGEQTKQKNSKEEHEEIAKIKKVPAKNILIVKPNSNLYKDHPNLEPNLYFYKDDSGVVRAEYLDEAGNPTPSKYFEPSTTGLRQQTVSLGSQGNDVKRQVPHQVMKTKGLNNVDKDVKDIRISINIDSYGYLKLEETRQGTNGEWLSHDIEVKGRDYNSHEINEITSIKTRVADPSKQTETFEETSKTGLAEDGIKYSEMYLIQNAEEIINSLIEQGYQKKEAVKIFDYMIGEEQLTLKEAKQKVNEEIGNIEKIKEEKQKETGEERTPWGDAENRRMKT